VAAAIGLGANLGDPRATFAFALARIAPFVSSLRVSPLYRTAPIGGPPQPDYLNAAAVFRTSLAPEELLESLRVPHPRLTERRFVLAPLADLVPGRVVPGTGRTVGRLLAEAPPSRVEPAGLLALVEAE